MDGRPNIQTGEPSVSRAIIERTDKSSIMWQRTVNVELSGTNIPESPIRLLTALPETQIGTGKSRSREGKSAKIATTENRRIQSVDRFIIDAFNYGASQI